MISFIFGSNHILGFKAYFNHILGFKAYFWGFKAELLPQAELLPLWRC